ncbi:hypothetical protein HDG34_004071 [Paraburkholderia sp. HC6.4b]|nr:MULTISPECIES: hypothetical protein [unclassified Paraburkholderia]MBB5410118.1 hypothetical protein [Paraburkholderia sp. HC6.4b]MBB5451967.1 hypothetical protein [Paraburkholderia sp. Kb1A]
MLADEVVVLLVASACVTAFEAEPGSNASVFSRYRPQHRCHLL